MGKLSKTWSKHRRRVMCLCCTTSDHVRVPFACMSPSSRTLCSGRRRTGCGSMGGCTLLEEFPIPTARAMRGHKYAGACASLLPRPVFSGPR